MAPLEFLAGWEIPKNKDENLTRRYGLIIEYLAEAFHYLARKTTRFAYAKSVCKLGKGYVLAGVSAIFAAWLAAQQDSQVTWLGVWMLELLPKTSTYPREQKQFA